MDETTAAGAPVPVVWTADLVAQFWDGMARAGLDDNMAFGRLARRCIHWIVARHLVPGGRHLDYGAGGGEVAAHLISQGFPFSVFEPSLERQRKAEQRLAGMAGFLGTPAGSREATYDAVTSFEVLEHVLDDDIDRVCDEIVGHVRPGGAVILSTPNSENLSLDTVYCPVSNRTFHRWQHVRQVSPDWIVETFGRRGVRKVCLHQLDFSEALFEPYLHMMGFADAPARDAAAPPEIVPLHIHQILHDVDSVMGGASRILFVGRKPRSE